MDMSYGWESGKCLRNVFSSQNFITLMTFWTKEIVDH